MQYIASFDIGTTNAKGILVSQDGVIHGEMTKPIHTYHEGNRVEQEPEEWWQAVREIAQDWWESGFPAEKIQAITLSGQMEDCIPIDGKGNPVRRAILYSDSRAESEAKQILERFGEEAIRQKTGNHIDGQMTFPKMVWLRENEPDYFSKTECFLISAKDYVIRQLTGRSVTDPTSAATAGMMNLLDRSWLSTWLNSFGLVTSYLPELLGPDEIAGYVMEEASSLTGFKIGTPVLCGIGDAGATTLGAGVTEIGEMYAYLGTTGWVALPTAAVSRVGNGVFHLAHAPKDVMIAIAPLLNAGNVHHWALSVFGDPNRSEGKEGFAYLEEIMANTDPSTRRVVFLPYLHGERCPIQDPDASGSFIGLKSTTKRGEMCAAVLEGVAMAIRQVMELLLGEKEIRRITLIGGGSRSRVWNQIIADVCHCNVVVPKDSEFLPALGAAAAGYVRLGWANSYTDFSKRFLSLREGEEYSPNAKNASAYDKLYCNYLRIYSAVQALDKDGC
ncbi:xylulokinase [Desulfosporosinus nitroreducens]|uniref:xylulokinase n=1 Tax=Desulfosporosinus nitroreducens TaxID=2018668 RepID=UPI00207D347C|nr:FGGY family carbohydrate kinase [Desulfosporosinus nitroreducens]MCO1603729.1 FGGY family carbohydrate kinase [Desulfosporosinus nitroreducens]